MIINDTVFNVDLVDVIDELRQQLEINHIPLLQRVKDTPDNYMVACPYHKGGQERKPSAGIKKSDGTFHCFACGETHTLQEVISHCFGHYDDLLGAFGWNWLLKNFLTVNVEDRKDVELDFNRNYVNTIRKLVSEEELDSYREYHPYMWKRKLTPEVVEIFDVGFDKNTNSITFPIRNAVGDSLFIARRSVNTKWFNYPSGAEKPVYGLYELLRLPKYPNEVIICESIIDALTCWVYGKYAVALNGLGTELQFKQLRSMPCRKFILATDMDSAGQKARIRLKRELNTKLVSEYLWDINIAKDINDMSKDVFDSLEEVF